MRSPTVFSLALTLALTAHCSGAATPAATTATAASTSAAATPVRYGDLDAALAGPQRSAANRARDAARHPRETLAFFGVEPGKTVVELAPGSGWYTEILAPLLHDAGALIVAMGDPANPRNHGAAELAAMMHAHPEVYGSLHTAVFEPPARIELGPDASADVVLTFRSVHGWLQNHAAEQVFAAAFRVLKPGGVFGVVEHRANEGADPNVTARQGYVPVATVVALAQAAGFVLDGASEINANPRDTKDYPEGVWTLPPTLRLGERDRARYVAIGESDRMTLRFRKPAAH